MESEKDNHIADKKIAIMLLLHAHSIIQFLLGQSDSFYLINQKNKVSLKEQAGQRMQKKIIAYQKLYALCCELFIEKVQNFYTQNGHNIGMWKNKTACLKDILETDRADIPTNKRMVDLLKQINSERNPNDQLNFPQLNKFDDNFTKWLKENVEYKPLFTRKS